MTSIDLRTEVADATGGTTAAHRRKAQLFCPRCGHRSAVDGDWRVERDGSDDVYTCPVCAEVVAVR